MSKIWVQSLKGRAIDLLDVDPRSVDFFEMCEQLAKINRHLGATESSVSVAFHTLIALDCADEEVRPWVALHDFPVARLGHFPTATRQALDEVAAQLGGQFSAAQDYAWEELWRRHLEAVHKAGGLPMPTTQQRVQIMAADLRAYATERRDFMAPAPRRRSPEIDRAPASTRVYRAASFGKSLFDVAQELHRRLQIYLPTLVPKRVGVRA